MKSKRYKDSDVWDSKSVASALDGYSKGLKMMSKDAKKGKNVAEDMRNMAANMVEIADSIGE